MASSLPRVRWKRKRLTPVRRWTLVTMFLLPLVIILLKQTSLPAGELLREFLSLDGSAREVQGRVHNVLLVPLGAAIVVFFRVTLGIRVLGPFRSVLLALAFQVTGVPLGTFFLALVISALVLMRRWIRRLRLPYFGRLSVVVSMVAAMIMLTLVAARAFGLDQLSRTAYFPIVVLCLTADGFVATLRKEGTKSALWRGIMTAAVAIVITYITRIPGFEDLLAAYPELLFAEIGLIIVISYFLGFRLLSFLNPKVKRKRRKSKRKAAGSTQVASAAPSSPALALAGGTIQKATSTPGSGGAIPASGNPLEFISEIRRSER